MSTSKGRNQTSIRQPKCARCRYHGFVVLQKGHMRNCPFLDCTCWKCHLITRRSKIMALHRQMKMSEMLELDCPSVGPAAPEALSDPLWTPPQTDTSPVQDAPQTPPRQVVDGKIYAELQNVATGNTSSLEETLFRPWTDPDPPISYLQEEQMRGETQSELMSRSPDVPSGQNLPHVPDFGQRDFNSAEMLAVPSMGHPIGFIGPHSLVMNMPPMPPGTYEDGPCGSLLFPHFQTGTRPHSFQPDTRTFSDAGEFFHASFPSMYLSPYQGELMQSLQPQPHPFPKVREHGTDGHASLSSQVLDESFSENSTVTSSQFTT